MDRGRVDSAAWLARLLTWDGLLPLVLWTAPRLVASLLPGRRGAIELTAVLLPVAAFLVRLQAGIAQIRSNRCGRWARSVQAAAFVAGILLLMLIDCVVMLSGLMPRFGAEDRAVAAILGAIYLALMAVAMYPGREAPPEGDSLTGFE